MEDQSLQNLYPVLTDDERKIAEENLDRYLELASEIYQAMQQRDHPIDG